MSLARSKVAGPVKVVSLTRGNDKLGVKSILLGRPRIEREKKVIMKALPTYLPTYLLISMRKICKILQ